MNASSNTLQYRRVGVFVERGGDHGLVDLTQDHDLSFWTDQLNCSAEKLLAAVESVGPRVEHVTEYLRAGW